MYNKILVCGSIKGFGRNQAETVAAAVGGEVCFWEDMALEIRCTENGSFRCGSAWDRVPQVDAMRNACTGDPKATAANLMTKAVVPVPLEKPVVTIWHKGRDLLAQGYDLVIGFGWYGEGKFGHYGDMALAVGTMFRAAGADVWNREMYMRGWRSKVGLTFLLAFNGYLVPDTLFAPDPGVVLGCLKPGTPYIVKSALGTHGRDNYLTDDFGTVAKALKSSRSLVQAFIPNDHDLRVICFGTEPSLKMVRSRQNDKTHLNNTSKGAGAEWGDMPEDLRSISREIAALSMCDMAGIDFIETDRPDGRRDYWCLEVNVIPQLVTGFDPDRKMAAFADAVHGPKHVENPVETVEN